MDVLEDLEPTVAVRCLERGDLGVIAVEADGNVGPLAGDRVTADDAQTEVGEQNERGFDVANGDANVLQLDRQRCTLPSQGDSIRSRGARPFAPRPLRTRGGGIARTRPR
jgi:hypothetical protein